MHFINAVTLASALLLGTVSHVSAHGHIKEWTADGKTYGGFVPGRGKQQPTSIGWYYNSPDTGPVFPDSYGKGDIICGKDATPGQEHATVAAGSSIKVKWNQWPETHLGPILIYMAKCDGECEKADKYKLRWFKIFGCGLVSPPKGFCNTQILTSNDPVDTFQIPASLNPGNYVVRYELIALHQAQDKNGAQNYPQCANLKVTGSGSVSPPGILGTELYSPQDPGLDVNIYYPPLKSYSIPGPPVFDFSRASNEAHSPASDKRANQTPTTSDKAKPAATANSTDVEGETASGTCKSPERPMEMYPKIPEADGSSSNSVAGNGTAKSGPDDCESGGANSTSGACHATPGPTSPKASGVAAGNSTSGGDFATPGAPSPKTTTPETTSPETTSPETSAVGNDNSKSGAGYGTQEKSTPEAPKTPVVGGDDSTSGTGHGTPEDEISEATPETPGADNFESFIKWLKEWLIAKVEKYFGGQEGGRKHARHLIV